MAGWANSDRASRLPSDWQAIRARVLARDAHRCQIRGEHCTVTATEVDHIRQNDDHQDVNLQSACHTCHAEKTVASRANRLRLRPPEPHPGVIP